MNGPGTSNVGRLCACTKPTPLADWRDDCSSLADCWIARSDAAASGARRAFARGRRALPHPRAELVGSLDRHQSRWLGRTRGARYRMGAAARRGGWIGRRGRAVLRRARAPAGCRFAGRDPELAPAAGARTRRGAEGGLSGACPGLAARRPHLGAPRWRRPRGRARRGCGRPRRPARHQPEQSDGPSLADESVARLARAARRTGRLACRRRGIHGHDPAG